MKYKILLPALLIAASVLIYNGCKKGDDIMEGIAYITVIPQAQLIVPGGTVQFKAIATMVDSAKEDISGSVKWNSYNENIATIDDNGLATGKSKGYTFISAQNGYILGSTQLGVTDATNIEKALILQDYEDNYLGSENPSSGWTGNAANCVAGDVPASTREKVLQRVNYFRRLVGLSDNIVLIPAWNAKDQVAALMFTANSTISHYPPASWACYHADGAEAAGKSNIAYGMHSVNAITGYMEDFGANNLAVGHRRWILYSQATEMGTGSSNNTNALWVLQSNPAPSNPMPEFIAYPPKGYVPAPIVWDRWHFGMPNAGFSSASVTMKDAAGNNINLNVIEKTQTGVGDNSIVWEPSGISTSGDDIKYTVTVSGITGAPKDTYTYDVILVQPAKKKKTEYQMLRETRTDLYLGDAPVKKEY